MDFVARPFCLGDEGSITDLWNRSHSRYGGYIPRTPEFWSWNVLQRPGILRDDIVVVTRDAPVAFGVLGPSGTVLEFAVDANLVNRQRGKACRTLIHALEERARARNQTALSFTSQGPDKLVNRTLRRAGYRIREKDRVLGVGILDPREVVCQALNHNRGRLPRQWTRKFSLEILPGDYLVSPHGQLEITVGPDGVEVEQWVYSENIPSDCALSMDLVTLSELVFTRLAFSAAVNEGRIRLISGSMTDAEQLCHALALHVPWHSPPSDLF